MTSHGVSASLAPRSFDPTESKLAADVQQKLHLMKRKTISAPTAPTANAAPMEISQSTFLQRLPENNGSLLPNHIWAIVFSKLPAISDKKALDLTCKTIHRCSPFSELHKIRQFLLPENDSLPGDLNHTDFLSDPLFRRTIRAFVVANVKLEEGLPPEFEQNQFYDYISVKIATLLSAKPLPDKNVKFAEALWYAARIRFSFEDQPWSITPPQVFSWYPHYLKVKQFVTKVNTPKPAPITFEELKGVDASIKVLFERSAFKTQCKESDPAIRPLLSIIPRIGPQNLPAISQFQELLRAYCYAASRGDNVELLTKSPQLFGDDERLVRKVVKFDGLLVNFISDRLRKHFDIGLIAVKQNAKAYFNLDAELKKNPKIIDAALEQNPTIAPQILEGANEIPEQARKKIRKIDTELKKSKQMKEHPAVVWAQVSSILPLQRLPTT